MARFIQVPPELLLSFHETGGSAPSFYHSGLRKIFGVEKPKDHDWSTRDVEGELERQGFEAVKRIWLPLRVPIFPLFSVAAWRKR